MSTSPRIAITADTRVLRCRLLIQLIQMCGAVPVPIPFYLNHRAVGVRNREEAKHIPTRLLEEATAEHLEHIEKTLSTCNGVIIPGNPRDVPPEAYGATFIHPETAKRLTGNPLKVRFVTETLMANYALEHNWPLLGICGGMQVTNVVLGGSLVQHLPDDSRVKKHKVKHRDPKLKHLSKQKQKEWERMFESHIKHGTPLNIYPATHGMRVETNSSLAEIYRSVDADIDNIGELSIHHQGCFEENLGKGLKPVALAPDGVVEAIEMPTHNNFFLLTQFHPECNVSGIAKALVQRLVSGSSS